MRGEALREHHVRRKLYEGESSTRRQLNEETNPPRWRGFGEDTALRRAGSRARAIRSGLQQMPGGGSAGARCRAGAMGRAQSIRGRSALHKRRKERTNEPTCNHPRAILGPSQSPPRALPEPIPEPSQSPPRAFPEPIPEPHQSTPEASQSFPEQPRTSQNLAEQPRATRASQSHQ